MKKLKYGLIVILIVLLILFIIFKLWVNHNLNVQQIPVLMYHNVVYDEYFDNYPDTISLSTFEKQLQYFKEHNYKTLTLEEFYCWKINKCQIKGNAVVLTFDDGFYSFHHLVEPLLEKYDMHAVNFVIGDTLEEKTIEYNPKKYSTIGIDLINNHSKHVDYQSHSYAMHYTVDGKPKVYSMKKEDIDKDITTMNELANEPFHYLSYPYNTDIDDFIFELKKKNYKLAFRGEDEKAVRNCDNFKISRIGVTENFDHFKSIFETKKYNNRYGNGLIRKVFITIERKLKTKLF